MYVGAVSAQQLDGFAEVPAFTPETQDAQIATNLLGTPIKDWQRPLDEDKRKDITDRFSRNAEFMPNPVLLAVDSQKAVKKFALEPPLFEIEVTRKPGEPPPLWIIDGQHRVRGLAKSERDNPIPFVLLYSENTGEYVPGELAKLFAEVSTEATSLDPLHNDWMQYAFDLGPYSVSDSFSSQNRDAMTTVLHLCRDQRLGEGQQANPFFNSIQLNPKKHGDAPLHEGFRYDASTLKGLIAKYYFKRPVVGEGSHLTPTKLARELARAVTALDKVVKTPATRSAFTGTNAYRRKALEDAFIAGALSQVLNSESPNWEQLLGELKFDEADWDLIHWIQTTGGNEGNVSTKVAFAVFTEAMGEGRLPDARTDIPNYLKGTQGKLEVTACFVSEAGRALPSNHVNRIVDTRGEVSIATGGRTHIRIRPKTSNIGKVDLLFEDSSFDDSYSASAFRKGRILEFGQYQFKIQVTGYGAKKRILELNLDVDEKL